MIDNKSRSDILLEEKIAKIDDLNFDKIYDAGEFAKKQLDRFEDSSQSNVINIENLKNKEEILALKPIFELEIQPNEFLDNHIWEKEEETQLTKSKFFVSNKPLFFAFASIAVLLCILFIYNVFVINSLEKSVEKNTQALHQSGANISYVVDAEENDYILFSNSSKMEIDKHLTYNSSEKAKTSNWFDILCNYIGQLFGG